MSQKYRVVERKENSCRSNTVLSITEMSGTHNKATSFAASLWPDYFHSRLMIHDAAAPGRGGPSCLQPDTVMGLAIALKVIIVTQSSYAGSSRRLFQICFDQ